MIEQEKMALSAPEMEVVELCRNEAWFGGIGRDEFKRLIIYADYMNGDILRFVPDITSDGKQVVLHFTASGKARKEDYFVKSEPTKFHVFMQEIKQEAEREGPAAVAQLEALTAHFRREAQELQNTMLSEDDQEVESNVQYLTTELDRLEKICGSNILGDVFFEVHDGENAVTNLSVKYPEVRRRMDALYQRFGFDILYEELEL